MNCEQERREIVGSPGKVESRRASAENKGEEKARVVGTQCRSSVYTGARSLRVARS